MSTSKNERARIIHMTRTLQTLGFTEDEALALRRISMTLRRWYELECGTDSGCIERDESTNRPYWLSYTRRYLGANDTRTRTPIADRESGARRRLQSIIDNRNARSCASVSAYIQSDPRGAALYIIRPGDVPADSDVDSCYTRGVCVF